MAGLAQLPDEQSRLQPVGLLLGKRNDCGSWPRCLTSRLVIVPPHALPVGGDQQAAQLSLIPQLNHDPLSPCLSLLPPIPPLRGRSSMLAGTQRVHCLNLKPCLAAFSGLLERLRIWL